MASFDSNAIYSFESSLRNLSSCLHSSYSSYQNYFQSWNDPKSREALSIIQEEFGKLQQVSEGGKPVEAAFKKFAELTTRVDKEIR